jgi:hypothetical protein
LTFGYESTVWCMKTIVLSCDVWKAMFLSLIPLNHYLPVWCLTAIVMSHVCLAVWCLKTAGYILLQYYFKFIFVYVRLRSHIANEERACLDAECWVQYCCPKGSNKLGLYKVAELRSSQFVRERTIPIERPPLVGEVIANFCGRSQRDGFLRPYSRFSRQEPLRFYQVAPKLYSRGWVDLVADILLFSIPPHPRKPGSAGNRTRASGSVAKNSEH